MHSGDYCSFGPSGDGARIEKKRLKGDTKESVFASLRDSILLATRVFERIDPNNRKNPEGVCAAFEFALKNDRDEAFLMLGIKVLPFVKKLMAGAF